MVKRRKKTSGKVSSAETEMMALLASKTFDQISDYSQRGRAYRTLSEDQLIQSWQSIWKRLVTDPLSGKKRDAQADIASEFALRGMEPPWGLVRKQIDTFLADSDRLWKEWRRQHPDAEARENDSIEADLKKFRTDRNRSN
jgi:hypothetical protein